MYPLDPWPTNLMDLYSKESLNPMIGGPFGLVIGWAPLGGVRSDIPLVVSVTFDS